MEIMELNLMPKNAEFCCQLCDFKCSKHSNWENHLKTKKHIHRHNGNKMEIMEMNFDSQHICDCGKKYKSYSGLWKHSKTCNKFTKKMPKNAENAENNYLMDFDTTDKDQLIMMLVKQNSELIKETSECKTMMMEIIKNGTNNTTHTNSHNKTFNMQIFLNETCKDALNIADFVNSVKLSIEDLEYTGRKGYIEGISNIIVKNLNNLEEYKRPIHCSDFKREILYIKDNDTWTKEDETKPVLTKAIKTIANENIKQIKEWRDLNPDCTDVDSKKNNLYLKIVSNSMNGSTQEESNKNIHKIISNVAKEVIINK
jgi:hypothetical protein